MRYDETSPNIYKDGRPRYLEALDRIGGGVSPLKKALVLMPVLSLLCAELVIVLEGLVRRMLQ